MSPSKARKDESTAESSRSSSRRSDSSLTLAFPLRIGSEESRPPSSGTGEAEGAPPAVPERIGPYRLLEVLGEGGMGTVYLAAQDEPLERRVALKLIRSGRFDRRLLRRFEAERQALARMSHPNIAQVYGAGTALASQPYIAMELVPGLPITEYCDRHRLPLAWRLELFAAVCDGVQHAHQKAILHRDLKPSNLLVMETEGGPVPKIIDFGLAKALDAPRPGKKLTGENAVVGTAAYLSPEAIQTVTPTGERDVDTRADVYALGVVLYELLAGMRPFDGGGASIENLRRTLELEVPPPSVRVDSRPAAEQAELARRRRLKKAPALRRALRGDLDTLVLKAMARDRSQRYGSAADLAADIRRFLAHEALLAAPPTPLYRLRKLVRRHRAAVAAVALIVLTLAGGFVARSLEAQRANREAERASREAQAARQVADFLAGLFERSAAPTGTHRELTARQVLDRGAQSIREDLDDQPLLKARLMDTIGNVYRGLGAHAEAEPLLLESLDLRQRMLGPEDPGVAEALVSLAILYREKGDPDQALPLLQRAVRIQESQGETLPLARCLLELASTERSLGRTAKAEDLLQRVIALREEALGSEDVEIAAALDRLGNVYQDERRFDDAERTHLRSLEIKTRALGPVHPHVVQSLDNLADVYTEQGRSAEAEALRRRAAAIEKRRPQS
jgi:non-specific serine/threonine protein kinase/serine/threonine-protein kinase